MNIKRRALLIGNNRGASGVNIDIDHFSHFLKANIAGAWEAEEIVTLIDRPPAQIQNHLALLRKEAVDYLIVFYSGHGGQLRMPLLPINSKGETLREAELHGLADRQLNIYDACQVRQVGLLEAQRTRDMALKLSFGDRAGFRAAYDKRIRSAVPQEICLYACKPGQTASSTPDGGFYVKNLLHAAHGVARMQELTVRQAHQQAWSATILQSKAGGKIQDAEAFLPRCFPAQDLILSFQP